MHYKSKQRRQKAWDDGVAPSDNEVKLKESEALSEERIPEYFWDETGGNNKRNTLRKKGHQNSTPGVLLLQIVPFF